MSLDLEQFCNQAKELQTQRSIPSVIVSIVQPSGITLVANGSNTDENTIFPIGSLSKGFAAAVVGLLVDQGRIDWNDSIRKFVDVGLTVDLTVAQLLSHINPFPEHALTQVSEFGFSREELWHRLQYVTITDTTFKFSYQNVLFSLVAAIVEKITGKQYEDYLTQVLLVPLNMLSTTAKETDYLQRQNKAAAFLKEEDSNCSIESVSYCPYWHILGPPSCVSSSASDLTKWLQFNLQLNDTNRLISEKSLNRIHSPLKNASPPYAMGWWAADERGLVLCHTGAVTGFEAAIAMIPSLKVGIAVCSNLAGDSFPYEIVTNFVKLYLNEPHFYCTNVLSSQFSLSECKYAIEKILGRFCNNILSEVDVFQKDNQLYLQVCSSSGGLAKLSPIRLNRSHHTNVSQRLQQLAPHHCFTIQWCSPAGKLYYDEDKIAFYENERGEVDSALLLAVAIDSCPLVLSKK